MSRPRVLWVGDRSPRATAGVSLTEGSADVVAVDGATEAVERLERATIDAAVIDASTVADVSGLVDTVASAAPGTPTFVFRDGALSEVVARTADAESGNGLAEAVVDRVDAGPDAAPADDPPVDPCRSGSEPTTDSGNSGRDSADELAALVEAVRCRLVDATSPLAVERALREELTADDRFAFAWVGEYDRRERAVVPWLSDPEAMAWSIRRPLEIGDGEQPLLERAMRAREVRTRQYDETDAGTVPFGERAFEVGARSVAVAPLATADELYGVVVVYARATVSEREREAIRSTAEIASHVLETIEIRGRLGQQEQALHRYERLVETAGDGMYVLDDAGHFTTVNDALVEMTGYSREGLLGEHASILFDPEDVADGEETIRSLLADDRETDTLELSVETKAGDRIPCEVQIAVLVPNGEFVGSVGVLRDVTERERTERKLRERNERLDAFAQIVSHDLRNPLSVAQGYLDLLEETGDAEYADRTREGLDRMESIIEDVLAIARGGEWAADTEPVDLESVAREAWNHVSTGETTLSVRATTTLEADRSRLLRLLENCVRNSIEHGETTETIRIGPLEVDGREPDDEPDPCRGFFLEDDGEGLPEDLRDDLFDQSVSSDAGGLGIGLWVVREVAAGHGWSVVATESEDGGARFEFETGG